MTDGSSGPINRGYQLSLAARAPFSKQTLKANLADRVTQINAALSAFYRFVLKNKQRTENCGFPALHIPPGLRPAGQWGHCRTSP